MDEADQLCDRIAIIDRGVIKTLDTPLALKDAIRSEIENPTLDDVFLHHTGKEMREDPTSKEEAFKSRMVIRRARG
jgi:ABC-2 type transport system ATP-binding protein